MDIFLESIHFFTIHSSIHYVIAIRDDKGKRKMKRKKLNGRLTQRSIPKRRQSQKTFHLTKKLSDVSPSRTLVRAFALVAKSARRGSRASDEEEKN